MELVGVAFRKFEHIDFFNAHQISGRDFAVGILRSRRSRANQVDGSSAIESPDARHDDVCVGAMIHIDDLRANALGYTNTAEHGAAFVVHLHHVAVFNPDLLGVRWVDPQWLVCIPIGPDDFAGLDFPQPFHIVKLCMDTPAGMVRDDEERVFFRPFGAATIVMAVAFLDPMGNRTADMVIGELLGKRRRVELDLPRRGLHWMPRGIFCPFRKTNRFVLPPLARRN